MDSESLEDLNVNYKELRSLIEILEKRIHYLQSNAGQLAGAYVIFEGIMYIQVLLPSFTVHGKGWIPFCLSAFVSIAFWLSFINSVRDWVRVREQQDRVFMEQERLCRKIYSTRNGRGENSAMQNLSRTADHIGPAAASSTPIIYTFAQKLKANPQPLELAAKIAKRAFIPVDARFCSTEESPIMRIWIKVFGLRPHWFHRQFLYHVVSLIGKPLKLDEATTEIENPVVARMYVEINVLEKLQHDILIQIDGKTKLFKPGMNKDMEVEETKTDMKSALKAYEEDTRVEKTPENTQEGGYTSDLIKKRERAVLGSPSLGEEEDMRFTLPDLGKEVDVPDRDDICVDLEEIETVDDT
ncbi:hypothetical protein BUALT_Bualt10G0087700 [Buddleja alternifolia]|uniref:Uncharacterized protein n=1 Tax=Buddleja alternifolia TaxID=168488 RepID=A0AAV6X5T9_9LAMI|nr:hypothetical protein BUALT_Bualt10G0087700 [Buddleja alternifolia]